MAAFLIAQPFRAAEEFPDVAGTIGYRLPLHRVLLTSFRGAEAPRLRKKTDSFRVDAGNPFADGLPECFV
ncbi:MAG: hypothetical protein JG766_2516, partial [Desulfacinum sp.]|nr:hypothetical protein [Desulfacinum sp.]